MPTQLSLEILYAREAMRQRFTRTIPLYTSSLAIGAIKMANAILRYEDLVTISTDPNPSGAVWPTPAIHPREF